MFDESLSKLLVENNITYQNIRSIIPDAEVIYFCYEDDMSQGLINKIELRYDKTIFYVINYITDYENELCFHWSNKSAHEIRKIIKLKAFI